MRKAWEEWSAFWGALWCLLFHRKHHYVYKRGRRSGMPFYWCRKCIPENAPPPLEKNNG